MNDSAITYRPLTAQDADSLAHIDRSEWIEAVYTCGSDREIIERQSCHECPDWDAALRSEIQHRFINELSEGGAGFGAFDGERLAGFGVLAAKWRGPNGDRLQVDLMFVSRTYRRRGIGSRLMATMCGEARRRGARSIYISSTETRSAVYFYQSFGSRPTDEIDAELYAKEPDDIHMVLEL